MKALRWFQTKVGLFQDPRMMYLLSQPHGDSYFVIWFYLKDLAGMINDNGCIYVSQGQPVTTELLARQLRRRKAFVERVLDVFEQIDLISRDETGLMRIVPWDEIQSFSRDEKKRSDARDRMRRYRQRQREEQVKAAACALPNEMIGRMPDERIRSVNGQACEGYTTSCGKAALDFVQHDEQIGAILDEKMQNINEPTPETEPAASYGGAVMGDLRNSEKTVAETDKRMQSVNGQGREMRDTAPYGRAEWDCVHYGEQVGVLLDEKVHGVDKPTPETEPTESYGGAAVDYPRNGMKTIAMTDKKRLRVNGQAQQTGYAVPSGKAKWGCVQHDERIGVLLDEKAQNINELIPEREYAASYGGAVMGFLKNSEKDAAGPDEKVQSVNEPTYQVECAVANDGADLACTQLSERQELAAYDGDDIDGIQREDADEGISYVTKYVPGADSAADYLNEGQNTCSDREEPSSLPGGKALLYYEALFGKADGQTVEALQGLARRWGEEAVCRAICIALKKGASSVQYIHAVLVHSKGSPRHDTAPSPYETERAMPSGRGGLRHISAMSWGSPDVSLGEGIRPVYEALP